MADNVLAIRLTMLTPVDEPEQAWCDACALPSIFRWHVVIEGNGRLLGDGPRTFGGCMDCGAKA